MLLVGCDHATKMWAESSLKVTRSVDLVPGVLDLTYAQNTDVAFHLLSWLPTHIKAPLIASIGTLAVLALGVILFLRRQAPTFEQASYALLFSGAVGNLADRFARGYVVDFIHVHHWPIFNAADAFIVVGMAMLFFVKRRPPAGTEATSQPP